MYKMFTNLPRVYEGFRVDVPDWLAPRERRRYRTETLHHILPLAVFQRLHRHYTDKQFTAQLYFGLQTQHHY